MIWNEEAAKRTADLLLQIKAIKLSPKQPFTWASGWKSPIYCDNRLTLSFPEIRTYIKEQLAALVKEKFNACEVIAGVATAGISHGALVADVLESPFCYVRSSAKDHGLGNKIEGMILPNQKCVVIEDLISTGGSSLSAVQSLRESNAEVLGMAAIFTYGFSVSEEKFKTSNCTFYTLTDYSHLIDRAAALHYVNEQDVALLKAWREHPETWGQ